MRPGAEEFVVQMAEYYEVIVFTAALQDYADWVLDQIDPRKKLKCRLYRQHAIPSGGTYIKDLSRIGRPLNRVIIVDNLAENFQYQPENGIMIKSWMGEPQDTALMELGPILTRIGVRANNLGRDREEAGRRRARGPRKVQYPDDETERGGCTKIQTLARRPLG